MTAGRMTGIAVWDGERPIESAELSWEGDLIEAVSPAASDAALAEFSIIPGLVDTHVHLDASASSGTVDRTAWPLITPAAEQSLHVVAHLRQAAQGGVTTLRDLSGSDIQLAAARGLDMGLVPGPRLLVNGPVGMTAGHGDLFTPPHFQPRPPVADSPDDCRKLVRTWARAGCDGIKIYTSGGVLSMGDKVGWRNQTPAEIAATVDEAHALGMLVAAHTHTAEGLDVALEFGVDSIEHGTGIEARHIPLLLERNIPVAPTLLINDRIASGAYGGSDHAIAKAQQVVAERDKNFGPAAAAGVRFVLGTDASGIWVGFGDQCEEVRHMGSAFGWDAARALTSATSDAADALGRGNHVGRLRPRHAADFVVFKGRPWQNLEELDTANIVAVVSRGAVIAGTLPAGSRVEG